MSEKLGLRACILAMLWAMLWRTCLRRGQSEKHCSEQIQWLEFGWLADNPFWNSLVLNADKSIF